jgi:hypothetical protein
MSSLERYLDNLDMVIQRCEAGSKRMPRQSVPNGCWTLLVSLNADSAAKE